MTWDLYSTVNVDHIKYFLRVRYNRSYMQRDRCNYPAYLRHITPFRSTTIFRARITARVACAYMRGRGCKGFIKIPIEPSAVQQLAEFGISSVALR